MKVKSQKIWLRLAAFFAAGVFFMIGLAFIDGLPQRWNKIEPPPDHITIEDFRNWLGEDIVREGFYEEAGARYDVILGQPARLLASGPAAYLFDSKGRFVDWTPDMGDVTPRRIVSI